MRRTGRMNNQCFTVTDISEVTGEFDIVNELNPRFLAAFDAETKNRPLAFRQVLEPGSTNIFLHRNWVIHPMLYGSFVGVDTEVDPFFLVILS